MRCMRFAKDYRDADGFSCRFVLVGDPTVSTLPVFTQPATYGAYSVSQLEYLIAGSRKLPNYIHLL